MSADGVSPERGVFVIAVLELVGVEHGPADPLYELTREVVRLEIAQADSLSVHDRASGVVVGVGHYEYLRHGVSFRPSAVGRKAKFRDCGLPPGK
ncbi:MAG TPA: hypothetical protein VGB13_08835, partial [Candidatus Krumholzibacteria bacterium]